MVTSGTVGPLAMTDGSSPGTSLMVSVTTRAGAQAAAEFQVRAPLKEAGLTKADIRELSAQLGLPTADKPQMACLSSRVPYGEPVTPEKLRMIEQAENVLRDLGFYEVRVRHHEMRSAEFGVGQSAPQRAGRGCSLREG